MAIQMRRGLKKDFDPTKMLPGEWAVAIDADTNNQIVWMCFAPGVVKRMGTYEDFMAQMDEFKVELEEEFRGLFEQMAEEIRSDLALVDRRLHEIDEELEIRLKQPYISNEGAKTLTDSDDGYMRELKIDGATEQKQYVGKNMLDATLQTTTMNGITCTNNGDGTYTLNGTASADVAIWISGSFHLSAGTYRMVGFNNATENTMVQTYRIDGTNRYANPNIYDLDRSNNRELIEGDYNTRIFVRSGQALNNVVVKPMITADLSATYADYEPYVGGIPSPSPSYPQTIESVGKNMGCVDLGTLTWTYTSDGRFTTTISDARHYNSNEKANMYVDGYAVVARDNLGTNDRVISLSYVNGNYINIRDARYSSAQSFKQAMNGVKLAYELAEGATPSQYAVAMEVVKPIPFTLVKDDRNGAGVDNRVTAFTGDAFGHKVRIENHTSKPLNMQGWGFSWSTDILAIGASVETVIQSNLTYITFGSSQGLSSDDMLVNVRVYDLSTEKQTVIIPLSSPLYGIVDVRDYIDVERGVVVRNCGNVSLNSLLQGKTLSAYVIGNKTRYYTSAISSFPTNIKANTDCIVDCLDGIRETERNDSAINALYLTTANNGLAIQVITSDYPTQNDLKNKLVEKEHTLYYELATPTEEPIPPETLAMLRDLKTYYPSTNVTVTDGKLDVDTEFLYKLRLESYIKKVTGQITDTRKTIDNIEARQIDVETMTALAYINSEYASALAELN